MKDRYRKCDVGSLASSQSNYRSVLKDADSLEIFLRNMADFDRYFCELMAKGRDFTLKMEVHGNKGELIHVKVDPLSFDRPAGVEKRIEEKSR